VRPAKPQSTESEEIAPGAPEVREADDGTLSLYLGGDTLQTRTRSEEPTRLLLEYTRRMMGFLLFQPEPQRIAMIGLGGGALARYCRQTLPEADFTAIEISPDVIALRGIFALPADGPRFRILCENGAKFVRRRGEPLDVLLVDGFDDCGQPPELCSPAFYDACAARLGDNGVLVVNLHADEEDYALWLERIDAAFAGRMIVIRADESENGIVFAGNGADFPLPFARLVDRLRELDDAHPVDLATTVRKIAAYGAAREAEQRASRRGRRVRPRKGG
jgi:spermidine synthase